MKRMLFALAAVTVVLTGCGAASPNCTVGLATYSIYPSTGSADHTAASPGNQVQFFAATSYSYEPGCPVPEVVRAPFGFWTSSDPLHITIDSSETNTNGLATCTGSTNGAATLTAVSSTAANAMKATATLTCK
jgi:hypothetical protein